MNIKEDSHKVQEIGILENGSKFDKTQITLYIYISIVAVEQIWIIEVEKVLYAQ